MDNKVRSWDGPGIGSKKECGTDLIFWGEYHVLVGNDFFISAIDRRRL